MFKRLGGLQPFTATSKNFTTDLSYVLSAFFDGLAQGMEAEVNAVLNFGSAKGSMKKGQMEFVSKAFTDSMSQILSKEC